jgi:hypothetical protein
MDKMTELFEPRVRVYVCVVDTLVLQGLYITYAIIIIHDDENKSRLTTHRSFSRIVLSHSLCLF